MSTLGLKLRELREQAGFSLRKAAVAIDIDVAILSKMERGERKFSKELVLKLAELYNVNSDKLIIDFLSEKVLYELEDEEFGLEALKVAEKQLEYKKNKDVESR
jgi:transcriptional regulator with XRE-family HTH domain